jgi:hypothetical protein
MTNFTTLSDATLAQDKPITQAISRAWRDNPVAIAEGDSTAPVVFGLNGDAEVNASAASSLTWTGTFDADFDVVTIEISGVGPVSWSATQELHIEGSSNSGASWGTPVVLLSTGQIGGGGSHIAGTFQIYRPTVAGASKYFCGWLVNPSVSAGTGIGFKSGLLISNNPINGIRFRVWETGTGSAVNMNGRLTIRTHRRAANV